MELRSEERLNDDESGYGGEQHQQPSEVTAPADEIDEGGLYRQRGKSSRGVKIGAQAAHIVQMNDPCAEADEPSRPKQDHREANMTRHVGGS